MRLPTYSSLCYCGLVTYIQVSGIITNQNIMAEKVFLNRKRAIPIAETHSISREDIPSTTRNIAVSEKLLFRIWYQTSKSFPKFNATGYVFLIKFNSPLWRAKPSYPSEGIHYSIDNIPSGWFTGTYLVGLKVRNIANVQEIWLAVICVDGTSLSPMWSRAYTRK